jgi:hypothetical protein
MKRLIGLVVAAMATLAIATPWMSAQSKPATTGDARVKVMLDKLGWKYEVDKDGDYKLLMKVEDRSQIVYILSKTHQLGDMEIREMTSVGYVSEKPFSGEIANQLLMDNTQKKLGAWEVLKGSKSHLAMFNAKVKSDSSPEELAAAVMVTAISADAMELSLTKQDKF